MPYNAVVLRHRAQGRRVDGPKEGGDGGREGSNGKRGTGVGGGQLEGGGSHITAEQH